MGRTSVLSTEEVYRWRDDDVTQDVFARIVKNINGMDQEIHNLLLQGGEDQLMKAAFLNARMQQLKEVLTIHKDMIEDLKGE